MTIDLNPTEEQELIGSTANEFFEKRCPPERVRESESSELDYPQDLWSEMAELGWLGMPFAEQYQGLGCSVLDMYPLCVELGRHLVPCPYLDTVVVAGSLLSTFGSEAQKKELLPQIAGGNAIVSTALMEVDGSYGAQGIQLHAERSGSNFVLNGSKVLVSCAPSAHRLLTAVRTAADAGDEGVSLLLIDPGLEGIAIEPTPNIAGYPLYAVTFDGVRIEDDNLVGEEHRAWPALHETMMKTAVLQSAMVVGAGERILEMTAHYAKEREQFGQPIGKYQAVQYLCTDIAIHGHLTRLLTLQAAWLVDSGKSFVREAALAKASASRAAAAMTFAAHEVHAGIGFISDYDLQLYTRRAKHWEWNLGDYRYHIDQACTAAGI